MKWNDGGFDSKIADVEMQTFQQNCGSTADGNVSVHTPSGTPPSVGGLKFHYSIGSEAPRAPSCSRRRRQPSTGVHRAAKLFGTKYALISLQRFDHGAPGRALPVRSLYRTCSRHSKDSTRVHRVASFECYCANSKTFL